MLEFWGESANDADFKKSRHRTLPIPESVFPVPHYPTKLRIYKTQASPYWQVQSFFKGKTYRQSLRTTHKNIALWGAKDFFHQKVAQLYGNYVPQPTNRGNLFRQLIAPTISVEVARNERGELSNEGLRIFRTRLYKHVEPFFGDLYVKEIDFNHMNKFVNMLSKQKHSTTTIQQYLVAVRKVLNYAHASNLIDRIPKFPTIKTAISPRGSFSITEYRKLVTHSRKMVHAKIPVLTSDQSVRGGGYIDRNAYGSEELQYLIIFMVNSFIRPSDIKNLKHEHVTVVRNEYTYLRLNLPESKSHDKPIVTMVPAVRVYERLLAIHQANGYGKHDDYVFMPDKPDRRKMLMYLGYQFKYLQVIAGIKPNASNGKERTLYSLRHTAITFRLLYGANIDLLTLARNARTSVEMVEKFYSSNLTAEMNIGLLQGKRSITLLTSHKS